MSILLEQVSKRFEGQAAVSDVSVSIEDGEFFVLLGPSGSGKSTLLRAIAGLTSIDHGRIVLHGREVTNLNAREREVGFVFQHYALFRHMTVGDNIEFALRARRVRAAERKRRRQELLELVALAGFDDRLPTELSGGQQQRVAVARALAHEPRVLLLDEPFGALDAKIRDELRRAIRGIQRTVGITTILVTHDQEEAFTMADRIGVMDRGRLQEVGVPRTLYAQPRTRFVAAFLGTANLLLGRHDHAGVRIGESCFASRQRPAIYGRAAEATVVIRPEDLLVSRTRSRAGHFIGAATVAELEFSGALERVRLTVTAGENLASARHPDQQDFVMEACRQAIDSEPLPLAVGQRVYIGARCLHVLPTLVTSLRLISGSGTDATELASCSLVRDLSERMNVAPARVDGLRDHSQAGVLGGLPIVALDDEQPLTAASGLLQQGAYQVLAVDTDTGPIERMLIYTQSSRPAREGALSTASSLLRHLPLGATLLVPSRQTSNHSVAYRELLDLRSGALREHGVDVQTETFAGELVESLRGRLEQGGPTLLLVGLTSLAAGASLLEALTSLCRERRGPAAVLIVCLNREADDVPGFSAQRVPDAVRAI